MVKANSRFSLYVNGEDPLLDEAEISAVFTSLNAVPIIVERSMYLDSEVICENPKNLQEDPVLGGTKRWTPSWLRSPAGEELCGPDANWFEAKHG